MSIRNCVASALMLVIGGSSLHAVAHDKDREPVSPSFPKYYRSLPVVKAKFMGPNWPGFPANGGQLDYILGNRIALRSYVDRPFDEGSVIVNERVHTAETAGIWKEDRITFVAIMIKESRRCEDTGGWCFNMWTGTDRTIGLTPAQAKAQCFDACHRNQADRDFVFSDYRSF